MRKPLKRTFRKAIAILDGRTSRTRGQSLVELSLTMPILLVMLLGLVEIGWLANNYLTLLDATREAGRYGSVRDPNLWQVGYETSYNLMDCDYDSPENGNYGSTHFDKYQQELVSSYPGPAIPGFSNGLETPGLQFYDGVACSAITNILPLPFNDLTDDVVISVFSYAYFSSERRIHVVGRLPSRSNECTSADEPYNPLYYDPAYVPTERDSGSDEHRLGYFFRGNHITSFDSNCRGSEFRTSDIEAMLNRTLLDDTGAALTLPEAREMGAGGMVLVEIFWQHEQLLGIPFFTFMQDQFEIHVWSLFPNTAAEPPCAPLRDDAQC
ncbi:MAG: pilus assembly protein [Chloroflexi bacterium]|nr:pilus assembly protein [Chloroflexota bacterium]